MNPARRRRSPEGRRSSALVFVLLAASAGPLAGTTIAQTAAPLENLGTTATDFKVGSESTWIFSFVSSNPFLPGETYTVAFPLGFNLTRVGGASLSAGSVSDSLLLRPSPPQSVTMERPATSVPVPGGTPVHIRIFGIINPLVSGPTGAFPGTLRHRSGDEDSGLHPARDLSPVLLGSVQAVASNPVTGASTSYVVRAETTRRFPAGAELRIQFPAGSSLAVATGSFTSRPACLVSDAGILVRSGTTLTLRRGATGPACPPGERIEATLTSIGNPPGPARSVRFPLIETSLGGNPIEQGAAAVELSGPLTNLTLSTSHPTIRTPGDYEFQFTTSSPWGPGDELRIRFPPAAQGLETLRSAALQPSCDVGPVSNASVGSTLVLRRHGGEICAPGERFRLLLSGVMNPARPGPSGPIQLQTRSGSGAPLDSGQVIPPPFQAAFLGDLVVLRSDSRAGAVARHDISFRPAIAWHHEEGLGVFFPSGFDTSAATLAVSSSCVAARGLERVPDVPQFVFATMPTGSCPPGAVVNLTLANVRNPSAVPVQSEPLQLALLDAAWQDLARSSVPLGQVDPGTLRSARIGAGNRALLQDGLYTVSFESSNPIGQGGTLELRLPGGYTFSDPNTTLSGPCSAAIASTTVLPSAAGRPGLRVRLEQAPSAGCPRALVFVLSGVINPEGLGPTMPWNLTTRSPSGTLIDQGDAVGVTITDAQGHAPPTPVRELTSTQFRPSPLWSRNVTGSLRWAAPLYPGPIEIRDYLVHQASGPAADGAPIGDPQNMTTARITASNLTAGEHALWVSARDVRDRAGPPQKYRFRVDPTPPTRPTIASQSHPDPAQCVRGTTASFSWSGATDALSGIRPWQPYAYQISPGGATVRTGQTSAELPLATDGNHTFQLTVFDAAGNSNTSEHRFRVDNTPPAIQLTAPATSRGPVTLRWNATDACAGAASFELEAKAPGAASFQAVYVGSGSSAVFVPSLDGDHRFRLIAIDGLGNRRAAPDTPDATVRVDREPPSTPSDLVLFRLRSGTLAVWRNATDNGTGIAGYHLHRAASITGPLERITSAAVPEVRHLDRSTANSSTRYVYRVSAVDRAGNEGALSPPIVVQQDATPALAAAGPVAIDRLSATLGRHRWLPLLAVDADLDGDPDSALDPEGQIDSLRALRIGNHSTLVLRGAAGHALWAPGPDTVLPLARIQPLSVWMGGSAASPRLSMTVNKHAGWIEVTAADPHPQLPVRNIEDGAGRRLPLAQLAREAGALVFYDDPEIVYTIQYGNDTTPDDAALERRSDAPDPLAMLRAAVWAAAVLIVGLGSALGFLLLRPRPPS